MVAVWSMRLTLTARQPGYSIILADTYAGNGVVRWSLCRAYTQC